MSKIVFVPALLVALALSFVSADRAFARRASDNVRNAKHVARGNFHYEKEADADAKFDEGHRSNYLCVYYGDALDGYYVEWYHR